MREHVQFLHCPAACARRRVGLSLSAPPPRRLHLRRLRRIHLGFRTATISGIAWLSCSDREGRIDGRSGLAAGLGFRSEGTEICHEHIVRSCSGTGVLATTYSALLRSRTRIERRQCYIDRHYWRDFCCTSLTTGGSGDRSRLRRKRLRCAFSGDALGRILRALLRMPDVGVSWHQTPLTARRWCAWWAVGVLGLVGVAVLARPDGPFQFSLLPV